jgi:hypothetical protein
MDKPFTEEEIRGVIDQMEKKLLVLMAFQLNFTKAAGR